MSSKVIKTHLWSKPNNLHSVGADVNIFGDDVVYLNCSPDGLAWFWVKSGDVRCLNEEKLLEAGFVLSEHYPFGKK
jgi:hypothetical protein